MPIIPRANVNVDSQAADEDTAFDKTLAVANTAEPLVAVPGGKKGRTVSLVNEGPGKAFISFDSVATLADVELAEGDAYSESRLEVTTSVSFIGELGGTPRLRGVLWSGA